MYYMTKEVKEKINDHLPGGSTLFQMDFASKGLSWVGNLYQKFEVSCNKYADVAGEHLRMILDDVASEFQFPSDDSFKGRVADKSLEHDAITEISKNSRVDIVESACNEKLSTCDNVDSIVSSVEDLSLVTSSNEPQVLSKKKACDGGNKKSLPTDAIGSNCSDKGENGKNSADKSSNEPQVLGQKNSCDGENKKSLPTEAVGSNRADENGKMIFEDLSLVTSSNEPQIQSQKNVCDGEDKKSLPTVAIRSNCSDDAVENGKKISDSVTSLDDLSSSLQLAEVIPAESHQSLVNKGRSSIVSGCISSTGTDGICTSQEILSFLDPPGNEHEQQIESNKLVASVQLADSGAALTEISGDFNREDTYSRSDVVQSHTETEEFEDVKLEDIWDDANRKEVALILFRKNLSYKKKLKNALISKVRSSKNDYNRLEDWYGGVDMEIQNRQMTAASSVPSGDLHLKISSIQDSFESEWELV